MNYNPIPTKEEIMKTLQKFFIMFPKGSQKDAYHYFLDSFKLKTNQESNKSFLEAWRSLNN